MVENASGILRVNNEIDFCSVTDENIKNIIEKEFLKQRVSYFIRWEKPNFFTRLFGGAKESMVFCINAAQTETAEGIWRN